MMTRSSGTRSVTRTTQSINAGFGIVHHVGHGFRNTMSVGSGTINNADADNLINSPPRDAATAYWMRRTEEQDLAHADMADPEILNRIIWFSIKGAAPMPSIARLPAFDAMRLGLQEEREEIAEKSTNRKDD